MQSAPGLKESVVDMNSLWDPLKAPNIPSVQDPWDFQLQAPFKNLGDPDATVKSGKSLHLRRMALWNPSSI